MECPVCAKKASMKCSGCLRVVYCSKEHQKADWKRHKSDCRCYEVRTNEALGRHMVATRNLRAGEMILKEMPTIVGPKTISPAICLGCHRFLEIPYLESDFYKCSRCSWPLCSSECESSEFHRKECEVFSKADYKSEIASQNLGKQESAYCVITPLRILLTKLENPSVFEKIFKLESHLSERRETLLYQMLRVNAVAFIRHVLGLKEFDEETILTAAAILDTNSFEIRLGTRVRALFLNASMLAHSCRPNARQLFRSSNFQMTLIASVNIPKGDLISISYTQPLKPTIQRNLHLKQVKCFICSCSRCKDPTEFGTYIGSLLCNSCKVGKIISTEPLNNEADWTCENCHKIFSARTVEFLHRNIKDQIEDIKSLKAGPFEEFLKANKKKLHPNCTHVLEVKYALTQLYKNKNSEETNRTISLCVQLLKVADNLEPGFSYFRSNLLKTLAQAAAKKPSYEISSDVKNLLDQSMQIQAIEASLTNP